LNVLSFVNAYYDNTFDIEAVSSTSADNLNLKESYKVVVESLNTYNEKIETYIAQTTNTKCRASKLQSYTNTIQREITLIFNQNEEHFNCVYSEISKYLQLILIIKKKIVSIDNSINKTPSIWKETEPCKKAVRTLLSLWISKNMKGINNDYSYELLDTFIQDIKTIYDDIKSKLSINDATNHSIAIGQMCCFKIIDNTLELYTTIQDIQIILQKNTIVTPDNAATTSAANNLNTIEHDDLTLYQSTVFSIEKFINQTHTTLKTLVEKITSSIT